MKKSSLLIFIFCLSMVTSMAQTFTNYTTSNSGLPHDNVLCVAEDTSGNIWFGTQDGVAKFDGVSNWTVYNTSTHPTLAHNTITAITVDSDNNVWVGTDYGASVFDGTNFTTYTTVDGLGHDRINYIAEAPNGDIWFGEFNGASVFDGANFTAYTTANGLPFGGVSYVDFDSNGDAYLGSGLGGFVHYDGANFTTYTTTDGLLSNVVNTITIDASDNKWVGTAKGISVFNNSNNYVESHTQMYILPPPDTLNPVMDIKINSQGDVWTGIYVDYLVTEGGVAVYDGVSSWTDYDVNDGLVGPVVRKMYIDKLDNVWVGTSTGVSKIATSTGVNIFEQETNNELSVYPNPANEQFTINIQEQASTTEKVEIYNATMQLTKEVLINQHHQSVVVSTNNLDKGIYFVKYGNQLTKLIIQ